MMLITCQTLLESSLCCTACQTLLESGLRCTAHQMLLESGLCCRAAMFGTFSLWGVGGGGCGGTT